MDNKFLFEEEISKKHKNQVLNAVQSELNINKKASEKSFFRWLAPLAGAASLAVIVYFQAFTSFNIPEGQNAIYDLAALTPDEIEMIDNIDLLDAIDQLSPEELEEIL